MKLVYGILCIMILTSSYSCKKEQPIQLGKQTGRQHLFIDALATEFLKDSLLHSVSIGIYENGEKTTAHYGEIDPEKGNKPTDNTLYEIASVSKTFAGALVAQAEIEGKLDLDDDIRKFLKGNYPNFEFEGEPIRVRHLLLHQAGFPQWLPTSIGELMTEFTEELPFQIHAIEKGYSKKQFFEDLQDITLSDKPGTNYQYSNVDVELTALILENIYETSYEDLLQRFIITPAAMNNTKIHLSPKERESLANGYGMGQRLAPHMSNTLWGADGGIKSTSADLVNYMEFLLKEPNDMVLQSQKVLLDLGDYGAGYFWPVRKSEQDGVFYNHHGGAFGTQNWFYIYPKHKIGISVITNQSDLETAEKLQQLVEGIMARLAQ